MPFWKKSDDPWDIDPTKAREKREKQEREPIESPLDSLKDWNEARRAKAAAKQAEWEAQPKEVCPWCGKEMERGCLEGGRGIYWYPGRHSASAAWWGPMAIADSFQVDDESDGILQGTYKTAWYCRDCRRMIFSLSPEPPGTATLQNREECQEELEQYARDAKEDGGGDQ